MRRREFVKSGMVATALGALPVGGGALAEDDRHWYEMRTYQSRSDMAPDRLSKFLGDAMVPAIQRAGAVSVGAFWTDVGAPNQEVTLLIDHRAAADALALPEKLERDAAYTSARDTFESDPHIPFARYESKLMRAFANHRQVEVPPAPPAPPAARVFELRTYESRNATTLARKIAMFNESEITLFRSIGMTPVFFGEDVFATGLPSLTYMLMFDSLAAREKAWQTFGSHPEWQRLVKDPRFSIEGITTTTRAWFLRALPFSQIR
jgi:hypothetical protein